MQKKQGTPTLEKLMDQDNENYIRIPQTLLLNKQYKKEEILLFIHILIKANTKAGKYLFDGRKIFCFAGCLVTVPALLAFDTGLKEKNIEGLLDSLEAYNFITQTKKNGNILIKVNNWEMYQVDYDNNF